jgi:hypothetical protein
MLPRRTCPAGEQRQIHPVFTDEVKQKDLEKCYGSPRRKVVVGGRRLGRV